MANLILYCSCGTVLRMINMAEAAVEFMRREHEGEGHAPVTPRQARATREAQTLAQVKARRLEC